MKNLFLGLLVVITSLSMLAQTAPVTSICMVTVDSTSTFNLVIWERLDQVSVHGIDSMFVYRQDAPGGSFNLVGSVDYALISEFEDLSADPNVQAYSYKIAGYDALGQLGLKSLAATTMHFSLTEDTSTETMELSWSAYIGGTVNTYSCMHATSTMADTVLFTTLTGSQLLWNMASPILGVDYEMFTSVNGLGGCTSTKANHNTSRSNKTTGGIAAPVGMEENNITELTIYPNPVTNEVINLTFSSRRLSASSIKIYNLIGDLVYSVPQARYYGQQSLRLNVTDLTPGLYLVSIENGSTLKTLRFSKK
jgi:hypothetical protein